MSKLFVTADTHFGHSSIIKYCNRPFLTDADKKALEASGGIWHRGLWKGPGSSDWKITPEATEMMDNTLIENINKMVGKDDILWHLGDFAFGPKKTYHDVCKKYRERINCNNVYLIWGNHDRREIADLFTNTYDLYELQHQCQRITLCHYAMAVWNKSHRGAWHLYGHSHSTIEPWIKEHMPNRRSFDVGVDNVAKLVGEYRPLLFDEIKEMMSKRNGYLIDHHGKEEVCGDGY